MEDKPQEKEKIFDRLISKSALLNMLEDLYDTKQELIKKTTELEKAKDYTDNIIKSMIDTLIVTDTEGSIKTINQATLDLLGYKEEEIIGQPAGILFSPEFSGKSFKKLIEEGYIKNCEANFKAKTGQRIPIIFSGSVMRDKKGNLDGVVIIARDITERKRMEEALQKAYDELKQRVKERTAELRATNESLQREIIEHKQAEEVLRESEEALRNSEEKYRSLTNQLPLGVYRTTKEGKFLYANPALATILEYESVEELMKTSTVKAYNDPSERVKQLEKWKDSGGVACNELKFRTKKGRQIWIRDTGRVILDGKGEIDYIDGIIEDLTERKRAEEKIKASLSEKEVLLREIHHRVKNNMQIISSLINLQSRDIKDEKTLDIFKESRDRIRSMALVHEKLYRSRDFARIDFGQYIQSLAVHLFHSYRVNANLIKLKIEVEDIFLDINTAVPSGLLINELVSNSLKHAFPGGRKGELKIGLSKDKDDKFTLIVKDNGVGFPENLDYRNTDSFGMQLVNMLVEQLNGSLRLERKEGTKFTIEFGEIKYKKDNLR